MNRLSKYIKPEVEVISIEEDMPIATSNWSTESEDGGNTPGSGGGTSGGRPGRDANDLDWFDYEEEEEDSIWE